MGVAIDTVGIARTSGASADTALSPATAVAGDSLTVRSFAATATARLQAVYYQLAAGGQLRITSPMLHDDVRGLSYAPGQSPAAMLMPPETGQRLVPADTLTAQMLVAAATTTDVAALELYYSDLRGVSARLHAWGDVQGLVENIKPLEIDITPTAAGTWSDALITSTENLLRANTDYAVLGYIVDSPVAAVGVKGSETGNLRICGPGVLDTAVTADYFISASNRHAGPHIVVFNSANANTTYATLISTGTGAVKVQLLLAELGQLLGG